MKIYFVQTNNKKFYVKEKNDDSLILRLAKMGIKKDEIVKIERLGLTPPEEYGLYNNLG